MLPLVISAAVSPWEREKTVEEHELDCLIFDVQWFFFTSPTTAQTLP